jgi:predicted aminopeptidase
LIESTRSRLTAVYDTDRSDADKRKQKTAVFADARDSHQDIASKHGVTGGFSAWFAGELNNAKIGSVAAYNARMPAFINMLRAQRLDFAAFYEYVAAVGELGKAERDSCLDAWSQQDTSKDGCPEMQQAVATAS